MSDNTYQENDSRLTAIGAVPPALETLLKSVTSPELPICVRLPKPGEREKISGASRSWILDANSSLPATERFVFRVKIRGKMRGAVFLNAKKFVDFLLRAEAAEISAAAELAGTPTEKVSGN